MGTAVGSEEEIAQLKARIELLEQQLALIEARFAPDHRLVDQTGVEQEAVPVSPGQVPIARTPNISLSADLRYRLDTIDDAAASLRHKHRIRARVTATAHLNERLTTGFGLSTGGFANDSANQTLGEGFSRKPVGLDLAYFKWRISERRNVIAGKMPNPFFRPGSHHLLYDDDLRPEGAALTMEGSRFFGNASVFWAEERADGPDSLWWGFQAGYRGEPMTGLTLTTGASFNEITHTQSHPPLFTPFGGQGNQLDVDGNYLYGFSQVELFGEFEVHLSGYEVTVFADYVDNIAAEEFEKGFTLGVGYRRTGDPRRWNLSYVFQDLEANAVIGAFTDSDFGGGTSDSSGHILRAHYESTKGWSFSLRYIIGKRGDAEGVRRDYSRLQVDVSLSH